MSEDISPSYVRQYNSDTDLQAVIHIFRQTCDDSLKVEPIWTTGSFIWCRPYLVLSPATCFVVDDGSGKAVGYILGTPDTAKFCNDWKNRYISYIEPELNSLPPIDARTEEDANGLAKRRDVLTNLIRNDIHKLEYGEYSEQLRSFPGHLHIDILPSHQRQGFGRKLIDVFKAAAKAEGCPGAYLGMVAGNDGAARFYEALGFERLPHVLDEGVSGEKGRTKKREDGGETIYFVVEL